MRWSLKVKTGSTDSQQLASATFDCSASSGDDRIVACSRVEEPAIVSVVRVKDSLVVGRCMLDETVS